MYADDSLVFCDAKVDQIRHLRVILTIFEALSGLHVNWSKSSIIPVSQVPNIQSLANNLGCQVGSLPTKYMGMPLGANGTSIGIWNEVTERCEKKLARWKSQNLSLGGWLTLINSVLEALPTYMMVAFLSKRVTKKIDRMRRDFLWQGNKENNSNHLVKWDVLTLSKKQGGLGMRKLECKIKACYKSGYGGAVMRI